MIVLVKTVKNEFKKAIIRDEVFYEADEINKKKRQIAIDSIAAVLNILKLGNVEWTRTSDWIETAQKNKFWGAQ